MNIINEWRSQRQTPLMAVILESDFHSFFDYRDFTFAELFYNMPKNFTYSVSMKSRWCRLNKSDKIELS